MAFTDPSGLVKIRISYNLIHGGLPLTGDTWIDQFNVMPSCTKTCTGKYSLEFTVQATIVMRVGPLCSGTTRSHEQGHAGTFANDITGVVRRVLEPFEGPQYSSYVDCYEAAFRARALLKTVPQGRGAPGGWRQNQPNPDYVLPCVPGM